MIMMALKAGYIHEGRLEGGRGQKFIIARHTTDSPRLHLFNYFAVNLYTEEQPEHAKIVQGFKINPSYVLGGGHVKLQEETIYLHGTSGRFGSIPKRFLDFFAQDILREYQQKYPKIQKISIDVPLKSDNDSKIKFLDQLVVA